MFSNKKLLITGGTGSFGNAVLSRFLSTDIGEIRIFSRDEKKQDDMRKRYAESKLTFFLGDVRDRGSLEAAMRGVDYVFHAAALKQVPTCEFYPMEAIKTNVMGTENVLDVAFNAGVKRVVCLSSDKAVYPINAMGMSKAIMEKIMIAKSRQIHDGTMVVCGTRYGNVMASRGSVIPLFIEQIQNNQPITITNPDMTRFMMSLEDAVELVLYAFENGNNGDIFVQKAPSATIGILAKSITQTMNKPNHPIEFIGSRHGEKQHETLLTSEEMCTAIDCGNYYCIPADGRDLNYNPLSSQESQQVTTYPSDYNSHNTQRLSIEEMTDLLKTIPEVKSVL